MAQPAVSAGEKALPHNLEAERSILGAILIRNDAFNVAAELIDADDFFRDAHRRVFDKMVDLNERGQAIDLVTLRDELSRSGDLDPVGGPAYISSLADGVPRSTNVEHYARIVKERSTLRNLIAAANRIEAEAYTAQDEASVVLDRAEQEIFAIAEGRIPQRLRAPERAGPGQLRHDRAAAERPERRHRRADRFRRHRRHDGRPPAGGSRHRGRPSLDGQDGVRAEHRRPRRDHRRADGRGLQPRDGEGAALPADADQRRAGRLPPLPHRPADRRRLRQPVGGDDLAVRRARVHRRHARRSACWRCGRSRGGCRRSTGST